MDYFEQIVARLLETRGYWVHRGARVLLSKADKRSLDKPSLPRPEIDIIAFQPRDNYLVLFEVKSYLDSPGVKYEALAASTAGEGRLKILTDARYQAMLAERIKAEYLNRGLINSETLVRFGLAAGNVPRGDRDRIHALCSQRSWVYISPREIVEWVRSRAKEPYENDAVMLAAKLVLRDDCLI